MHKTRDLTHVISGPQTKMNDVIQFRWEALVGVIATMCCYGRLQPISSRPIH